MNIQVEIILWLLVLKLPKIEDISDALSKALSEAISEALSEAISDANNITK